VKSDYGTGQGGNKPPKSLLECGFPRPHGRPFHPFLGKRKTFPRPRPPSAAQAFRHPDADVENPLATAAIRLHIQDHGNKISDEREVLAIFQKPFCWNLPLEKPRKKHLNKV